jgi:acyl-CoA thioester hydrolase
MMSEIFEKHFTAGWTDVDPNGHLANTSYFGFAVNTRFAFFAENGFTPVDFARFQVGPVIKTDTAEYFREIMLQEKVRVTIENGGHSEDGSRFRVVNNFYKSDGTHAARVVSIGGWLGLIERKLIEPPNELKNAWLRLVRAEDFEELRSSVKR